MQAYHYVIHHLDHKKPRSVRAAHVLGHSKSFELIRVLAPQGSLNEFDLASILLSAKWYRATHHRLVLRPMRYDLAPKWTPIVPSKTARR